MVNAGKLLTALFLAPLAGAADQGLLDFIMPDARVVFGADIGRMRSSPMHESFNQGVRGANPELRKLMEAAGFDPLRDLQEVLFASPGLGQNPPALVVARGTFDSSKLRAFAESAGSKITDFGGVPILSDPDKDSGAFALLDNIILAGNKEQVQAAIGRRGRGLILNTEMAMRIASLSRRYDAWLISIAPLATMAANLPEEAKLDGLTNTQALRAIEQFSIGIGFSADLKLDAEMIMTNAKSAGAFANGIQVLLGVAQKSAKEEPGIMAVLQNLNFGVDHNIVHMGFSVPGPELEKVVAKAFTVQPKKGPLTATRMPAPEPPAPAVQPPAVAVEPPSAVEPPAPAVEPSAPAVETPAAAVEPAAPAVESPAPTAVPEPPAAASALAPPVQKAELAAGAAATQVVRPPRPAGPVRRSPRIPTNGEILIQSSPKDMGTVVIIGSKK